MDLDKLNNLRQRSDETTVEYLERFRKENVSSLSKKLRRIKKNSGESIEGSDEVRKAMDVIVNHPDAFEDEVVRQVKENDDDRSSK